MKQPRGSTVLLTSTKRDDDDDKNDDDDDENDDDYNDDYSCNSFNFQVRTSRFCIKLYLNNI